MIGGWSRAPSPWAGSDLWVSKAKMVEDLPDHLSVIDKNEDSHVGLALGAG